MSPSRPSISPSMGREELRLQPLDQPGDRQRGSGHSKAGDVPDIGARDMPPPRRPAARLSVPSSFSRSALHRVGGPVARGRRPLDGRHVAAILAAAPAAEGKPRRSVEDERLRFRTQAAAGDTARTAVRQTVNRKVHGSSPCSGATCANSTAQLPASCGATDPH